MRHWRTGAILLLILLAAQGANLLNGGAILDRVITLLFIHVILAVALHIFMGGSGVVSFGQIAFMGIGAYASILFTLSERAKRVALPNLYEPLTGLALPYLPALIAAGLIAALIAGIVGLPLMRLSGAAAVIATFALLVIVNVILLNWNQVTNGPRTVFGIERLTNAWVALGWAAAAVIAALAFKESRWGLMLRASREDARAAEGIGVDIVRMRWIAWVISAFFTGAAGGLYAHFIGSFGASAFYLGTTFLILAMLVIGGSRSVSGAVAGVIALTVLSELLRAAENAINLGGTVSVSGATALLISLLMLIALVVRPGGLMGGREF
jgi:branched-chain amino acid transport system permease protein